MKVAVCSRSFSRNPVLRREVLKRYPEAYFNDEGLSLNGDSLVKFLRPAEKAITALETLNEAVISRLPNLRVIGKYGVGTDMIDFQALAKHNVKFGWTGGVNKRSVTELTICFMVAMLRYIPQSNAAAKQGIWKQKVGRQLSDQVVGIIGCGHVGKDLITLLKPFGCEILVNDILDLSEFCHKSGVEQVSLDELISKSDVVTLHVPKNVTTINLMSKERIAAMKQDAVLINAARGGIVDEAALKSALENGDLSGAGFDVLNQEPPEDLSLIHTENFFVTSHLGGSASEAILAMGMAAIDGLDHYVDAKEYLNKEGV